MQAFVRVDVQLGTTPAKLLKMEKKFQEHGISIVSGIGAEARKIAYRAFFSRTGGELRYNSPDRPHYPKYRTDKRKGGFVTTLRHREPLRVQGRQGYVDTRGVRLIGFSLENKQPSRKTAYFASYPMNLWEHGTKDGRPGKFIITQKLPPFVQGIVPKHVQMAEAKMADMGNAILAES